MNLVGCESIGMTMNSKVLDVYNITDFSRFFRDFYFISWFIFKSGLNKYVFLVLRVPHSDYSRFISFIFQKWSDKKIFARDLNV